MIRSLRIENYAIIDEVEIHFDKGLNIITGETGAGKSILLGALGLIMGFRADTKVLFDNSKKCIVEAEFDNYPDSINQLLDDYDYDRDENLIIRREIIPSGKSRAFVNDSPAKLDFLSQLNEHLVDLNQQFEISQIRKNAYQLEIIDAVADNVKLVQDYKFIFKEYKEKLKQLNDLQQDESTQIKEMDFMTFQLNELLEAALEADEQNNLETESDLLNKADEIQVMLQETKYRLSDSEVNLKDVILDLQKKWMAFNEIHPLLKKGVDNLDSLLELIDEIYHNSSAINADIDLDPQRLEELNSRLDSIYRLQKKHGVNDIKSLLEIQEELETKLASYINKGQVIEQLSIDINKLKSKLETIAQKLSSSRKKVFKSFEQKVNTQLTQLSMNSAEIKIEHKISEVLKADGIDDISLLFKSNKGAAFLPIKSIASGGESSRLMLSVKSIVAEVMDLPTMIFDEIDTGVSGEVAGKMGSILKTLSSSHQLICITHSPQVSSRAKNHYLVFKKDTAKRTYTEVKLLNEEERITEIAKMLSGDPPSTFALDNAKDLMHKEID